jgi:hypothetical protein
MGDGEDQLLEAGDVGIHIIFVEMKGGVRGPGGAHGGGGRRGGCGGGEDEEDVVYKKEGRDREISNVQEEVLVGQEVVHHTNPQLCGKQVIPPNPR